VLGVGDETCAGQLGAGLLGRETKLHRWTLRRTLPTSPLNYTMLRTTPPSTRRAAPVVALACALHT
jgi:hypothetical protein